MQMQDSWKWGFIPAQHHGFSVENLPTDLRHVMQAVRVKKRRTGSDELAEYEIVDESGGDEMGRHLWIPESEGAGTFPLQRWTSGWRHSWPAVAWTKDSTNRINRVEGDPVPTGGNPNEFFAFPIFKGDYKHDFRYAREAPALPDEKCFSKVAGGRIGIILSATREDEQVPLWMDCDSRLIAPHFAGDGRTGTLVADTNADDEIDPDRCARLQNLTRVIKGPSSPCADFHGENSLALNITEAGRGDVHGGLWADKLASGVIPPLPSGIGFPFAPAPQGTVTAAARALAFFSHFQGGPLVAGPNNDQHKFGVDADGNVINSGHTALKQLKWFSVIEDGPDKYDGIFSYQDFPKPLPPLPAPFSTQVYYEFDPNLTHQVCGVTRDGEYRWRAASFLYSPTDGGGVPDPRPRPEDEIPPPPGGLPIPPGPRAGEFTTAPLPPIDEGPIEFPQLPTGFQFEPDDPTSGPGFPAVEVGGTIPLVAGGRALGDPAFTERDPVGRPISGLIAPGGRFQVSESPPDFLKNPSLMVKDRRQFRSLPYAAVPLDLSAVSFMGRPQHIRQGVPDFRNWFTPTEAAIRQMDRTTPVTIRSEFYGAQKAGLAGGFTNDPWDYTERPGLGRWLGGTAPGGEAFMSPELDMADVGNAIIVPVRDLEPPFAFIDTITKLGPPSLPKSDVYKVAVPDTAYWAAGLPDLAGGGILLGYRWGTDSVGNLTFECVDKDGVVATVLTLTKDCSVKFGPPGVTDKSEPLHVKADPVTGPSEVLIEDSGVGSIIGFELPDGSDKAIVANLMLPENIDLSVDPTVEFQLCVFDTGSGDGDVQFDVEATYIKDTELATKAVDETIPATVPVINTKFQQTSFKVTLDRTKIEANDRMALKVIRRGSDILDTFDKSVALYEFARLNFG